MNLISYNNQWMYGSLNIYQQSKRGILSSLLGIKMFYRLPESSISLKGFRYILTIHHLDLKFRSGWTGLMQCDGSISNRYQFQVPPIFRYYQKAYYYPTYCFKIYIILYIYIPKPLPFVNKRTWIGNHPPTSSLVRVSKTRVLNRAGKESTY